MTYVMQAKENAEQKNNSLQSKTDSKHIVDNRESTTTSARLQTLMASSPVQNKLNNTAQSMVSKSKSIGGNTDVIQRRVVADDWERPDRNTYKINTSDRTTLYGIPTAPDPQPHGLYAKKLVGTPDNRLASWKPNVRLVSNSEKNRVNMDQDDAELISNTMRQEVSEPADDSASTPLIGVMGKNDCDFWAGALQALIHSGTTTSSGVDKSLDLSREMAPQMQVGDKMKHQFENDEECGYHAATVVAKDGSELITLEANVAKDLNAPEFYVRESISGFVNDNNTNGGTEESHNLGSKIEIKRPTAKENRKTMQVLTDGFHAMVKGNDQYFDYKLINGLGATYTKPLLDLYAATRIMLNQTEWASQGSGFRGRKIIPAGIAAMKAKLDEIPDQLLALNAVQAIAAAKLNNPDKDRSKITDDAYRKLALLTRAYDPTILSNEIKSVGIRLKGPIEIELTDM